MCQCLQEARNTTSTLAFWMANTSELLHFLKQDPDVSLLAYEYETHLTNIVQSCFKYFFLCITRDLSNFIAAFFEDSEEADEESSFAISDSEDQMMMVPPDVISTSRMAAPGTPHGSKYNSSTSSISSRNSRRSKRTRATVGDVMSVLSTSLSTLRKNNVNMSLIIQLFSQLIRFLNAKLVNKLMEEAQYCTRSGGLRLRKRLQLIDAWAKKQGLELTTERYLAQAVQVSSRVGWVFVAQVLLFALKEWVYYTHEYYFSLQMRVGREIRTRYKASSCTYVQSMYVYELCFLLVFHVFVVSVPASLCLHCVCKCQPESQCSYLLSRKPLHCRYGGFVHCLKL